MSSLTTSQLDFSMIINFLKLYRSFERQPLNEGFNFIRNLFANNLRIADHLCGHWKGKEREFGSFFMNLDYPTMLKFLDKWDISIAGKDEYLQTRKEYSKSESTLRQLLFLEPPPGLKVITGIVVFFLNHGISEEVTTDIHLTNLPEESKQYGNAANWADYILSLPRKDQYELLEKIVEYSGQNP